MKKKYFKSLLLTTGLIIGLSASIHLDAYAATHTVVKGDSLYKISMAYNTSVSNLMVANNLKSYDLNVGQVINIPDVKYTVRAGDTLYKISKRYNVLLFDLRQANNIWTDYIYVGQVLDIPLQADVKEEKTMNASTPIVDYTAEELDLLARLIMAETETQPYEAKVAVSSVVVNRVKSGLFAPTIKGVINQNINGYYQFTPVENGWIKRPANEECIKAAKEALSGVDTTNGALFYYDDSSTNQWILSKPVAVQYGRMIYAY